MGVVAVVAAASEAVAVRRALAVRARHRLDWAGGGPPGRGPQGFRAWEGHAGGSAVVLVRGGLGPVRAGGASRAALERFHPTALLALGFAGALCPEAMPGTLVLSVPPSHPDLLRAGEAAAARAGLVARRAGLVSAEQVAVTPQQKAGLAAATGCAAVDLEAASVAAAAAEVGVPFLAAKVIFDGAAEPLPPVLLDVVRPDGTPRLVRAAWMALRDREARAALHWAGRRARLASDVLTRFCRCLFPLLGAPGPALDPPRPFLTP